MRMLLGLGAFALSLGAAGALHASAADKDPILLAEKDRGVPAGRAVRLTLAQSEIATTIDLGRIAGNANGGGLLGALIITAMDDRAKTMRRTAIDKAEGTAAPIRQALNGFDVEGLAVAATRSGLGKHAWFQGQPLATAHDSTPTQRTAYAVASSASQAAFVDYWYGLSPDFSQIRVLADIRIERAGKRKSGIEPVLFHQRVWSVVQLRARSYDPRANAAQWSEADGKRARAGLTAAFARFEDLIPRALILGQQDVAAYTAKGREKAFGADFYGPLIARDPANRESLLLWSNGLVQVQPAD
ncbi:hypothetical protein P6144_01355 [Sphingomonas sp. HITSZ_GF]|uniref:hypothetical protein n=1 Tax=Sphingomonas sp. HITSZ_GF TaxID=3037247 RepID=UPI00240D7FF2|nr:hypothetical protein [Sphingomonas sp. HITSZ_GF]MDG2532282.1 hypothetical protein [Sphingomonas sp. HITSZ_GF]